MLDISKVKPGYRVTVHYFSPVSWARKTDNPFIGFEVMVQKTVQFTAAGPETYENMLAKLGKEAAGAKTYHVPATDIGPCVRRHKENGALYLAGINHDTVSTQFFVNGIPANDNASENIRLWLRKGEKPERGLDYRVWTIEKLENAEVQLPLPEGAVDHYPDPYHDAEAYRH